MTVCKFGSDILRSGTGLNLVVRPSLIISNDAKITAGLDKKDGDRVVGSGFRAADELGMMLAGTLKPATSRFCHGMVSKQWLKQRRSTQKRDTGQLC